MSFIDHLEDLRWHVIRSVIAVVIGAIIVFIYSDFVVDKRASEVEGSASLDFLFLRDV